MASYQRSFPIYGRSMRCSIPYMVGYSVYVLFPWPYLVMRRSVHDVPLPSPSPSPPTSTRSPHVTTIKKDCCTSIGSHLSLSLLRVRMVVSLPFPVLFKVEIRLRMNLERCPLEIKLIILLQVIQDKINMFQTWDKVSAFLSKGIFYK